MTRPAPTRQLVWRRAHTSSGPWALAPAPPHANADMSAGVDPDGPDTDGRQCAALRYGFAQTATDFYLVGGLNSSFAVTGALVRYNIATNVWTPLATAPATINQAPSVGLLERQDLRYRRSQRHADDDRPDL